MLYSKKLAPRSGKIKHTAPLALSSLANGTSRTVGLHRLVNFKAHVFYVVFTSPATLLSAKWALLVLWLRFLILMILPVRLPRDVFRPLFSFWASVSSASFLSGKLLILFVVGACPFLPSLTVSFILCSLCSQGSAHSCSLQAYTEALAFFGSYVRGIAWWSAVKYCGWFLPIIFRSILVRSDHVASVAAMTVFFDNRVYLLY